MHTCACMSACVMRSCKEGLSPGPTGMPQACKRPSNSAQSATPASAPPSPGQEDGGPPWLLPPAGRDCPSTSAAARPAPACFRRRLSFLRAYLLPARLLPAWFVVACRPSSPRAPAAAASAAARRSASCAHCCCSWWAGTGSAGPGEAEAFSRACRARRRGRQAAAPRPPWSACCGCRQGSHAAALLGRSSGSCASLLLQAGSGPHGWLQASLGAGRGSWCWGEQGVLARMRCCCNRRFKRGLQKDRVLMTPDLCMGQLKGLQVI